MTVTTYDTPAVSQRRLWYATTAAGIAWIVQGLTGWIIGGAACDGGRLIWPGGEVNGILIAVGVVALCFSISAGWIGYRCWRALSRVRELRQAEGRARPEFMALAGIFMSTIFTIGIFWATLIPIFVGPCSATR